MLRMAVKPDILKEKSGRQLQETFQIKEIVKLNEVDIDFPVGKLKKEDISRLSDIKEFIKNSQRFVIIMIQKTPRKIRQFMGFLEHVFSLPV